MSFTSEIKSELCKLNITQDCCAMAECYGYMLYANQFTTERIKILSDNVSVRKRLFSLLKRLIGGLYMVDDGSGSIVIEDGGIIKKVFDLFGYEYKNAPLRLNRGVIDDDCCKAAFFRGVFLVSGYLSEPEKGYHLELVNTHYHISNEMLLLLDETELKAKLISRRGNYVIYYKDSEMIEAFLTAIGATRGAMELMLKKVEKNLRNNVNRKVNCETSNLSKVADAAASHIEAINAIKAAGRYDTLPRLLRETALLRSENPEATLAELAEMAGITKPGLSGRIRKIMKLAEEYRI